MPPQPPPVPREPPISIVSVDPPAGYAGTMIKVTVQRQSDSIGCLLHYILNSDEAYVWRIRGDSVWILFPYVLSYSGMYIQAFDRRTSSHYALRVEFGPYWEVYPKPFSVIWWNNNWSIEAEYPWIQESYTNKTVINSGDTTTLVYLSEGPDWVIHKNYVFLIRTGSQLPAFLQFVQYGYDYHFFNDTLRSGLVKLERWDPHGVICGAVFSSDTANSRMKYFQEYFYFEGQ
jgi:hypothetical protein